MKVINPSARIMDELEDMALAQRIEACGRICYKSEDKITDDSAAAFVAGIMRHGHNSVMEMASILELEFKQYENQEKV